MAYSKYKSVYAEGSVKKTSKLKTGAGVSKAPRPVNSKTTTPKIEKPSGKGKVSSANPKYSNKVKSTKPKISSPSGKGSKKKMRKEQIDARFFALKRRLKEMIAENPEDEQLHEVYSNLHDMHRDAVDAIENEPEEMEHENPSAIPAPITVRANGEDTEITPTYTDEDIDAYDAVMDNTPPADEFDYQPEPGYEDEEEVEYGKYHDNMDVDNYDTLLSKPSKEEIAAEAAEEGETPEQEEAEYAERPEEEAEENETEVSEENRKKEEAFRRKMNDLLRKQMKEAEDKEDTSMDSEELPSDFTFPSEEDKTPHDPNEASSKKSDKDDDFDFEETNFDDADIHTIVKAAQEIVDTAKSASEKEEESEDKTEDSDKEETEKKEDKEEK